MAVPEERPPRSPLEEITRARFGGLTRASLRVVTVTTAGVVLMPGDPNRVGYMAQNRGVDSVVITFSPTVVLGRGLLIAPDGGWFSMIVEEDGEAVGYEVSGRTFAVSSDVVIVEVLRR